MGVSTSRVAEEIGENGTLSHKVKDLEVLLDLFRGSVASSINIEPFCKLLDDAKKKKSKTPRVSTDEIKETLNKIEASSKEIKEALFFLETNKIQSFICGCTEKLDSKNFEKISGKWKVLDVPKGSRLSTFDTLVDVIQGQKNIRVDNLDGKELSTLLKAKKFPKIRIHRKANSKKEMYQALRMPPPNIRLTLWDMDLCLLRIHTGGHTSTKIQALSKQVTEAFCYIIDIMIERKRPVGVVTFSDKLVAKATGSHYGGEDLVKPLVFHALRRHWMKLDRTLELTDAITKSRNFVENDLYVNAAYPEWRNAHIEKFKQNPMPNSKEWHIARTREDFKKKTGQTLEHSEMILFDDGDRNIDEANDQNVIGVLVDDKTGFTVVAWEEAMERAWTEYLQNTPN